MVTSGRDVDARAAQGRAPGLSVSHRLLLAAVGATPVSLIGATTFGVVGLRDLTVAVLAPGLVALAVLVVLVPSARSLVVTAVGTGMVATFLYDLVRWSFLVAGLLGRDPIPHIGTSLGLEPGWLYGYLWRYVGNGGGLAVVFAASGLRGPVAGAAHGLLVCSGLLTILAVSPHGQEALFPLVPATYVVAIVGHLIYGSALGLLWRPATARPSVQRYPATQPGGG